MQKIWLFRMYFLCVQWQPRSSTSQGALDRGSYFTFRVLPAPHPPAGGVGGHSHRGQPHPQFLHLQSLLVYVTSHLSSPLRRWRTAVLWPCWRRWPQSRADRTWPWPWWRSTWVRVWLCRSWTTSTPERSSTPVRPNKSLQRFQY